ncbi:MAG: hypothetical protein CMK59_08115 [Proteobacteria bacterium]|nr:hypothetical protein [Pseudomonadota bacterium]
MCILKFVKDTVEYLATKAMRMSIFFLMTALWAKPKVAQALKESQKFTVVVDDVLGEGGGFDVDPTTPDEKVNCLIWLQWVLSQAYSTSEEEAHLRLNKVRYYGGTVDYGYRKHFVDRWTLLEPEPLKSSTLCKTDMAQKITIDIGGFTEKNGYTGLFYEAEQKFFLISFSSRSSFEACLSTLPEGYYVIFPIATDDYLERWDSPSPMLQVHAMILEHQKGQYRLWHASIDKKGVVFEDPILFSERMGSMIQGFRLYELQDEWSL